MMQKYCHHALKLLSKKNHQSFVKSLKDPKKAQLHVLHKILNDYSHIYPNISGLDNFQNSFKLSKYADWKDKILEQKNINSEIMAAKVQRYEPTSGSQQQVKWIPYTNSFLSQLESAYGPWLYDLYDSIPELMNGSHYWSLSWLPDDLRNQTNNEANIFPFWKRLFLNKLMTLDPKIANLETSEMAQKAAILSLLSKDVTLISIWSPTYLLSLIDKMMISKDEIIHFLKNKDFQSNLSIYTSKKCIDRSIQILESTSEITNDVTKELWPKLKLISMWDTSLSAAWAQKVSNLFSNVQTQGKGLWATEGVVTIPFQNKYPLAINSHFYEFEELDSGKIYNSWSLEKGMRVKPYLTTGSGLFRYGLNDELLVNDFLGHTPTLKFIGRIGDVDIAGEKLGHCELRSISKSIESKYKVKVITIFAHNKNDYERKYELLIDGQQTNDVLTSIQSFFEKSLLAHFHYRLARELGQLKISEITAQNDAIQLYYKRAATKIKIAGNIKVEQVIILNS